MTKRALIQRINRALRAEDELLKTARGERAIQDLGEYFVIDVNRNAIMQKHVDLEELGRTLRVLKPYEALRAD